MYSFNRKNEIYDYDSFLDTDANEMLISDKDCVVALNMWDNDNSIWALYNKVRTRIFISYSVN